MMDIQEIAALLHIEEKTRAHPTLKAIHDAAMRKLDQHNNSHVEPAPSEEPPSTAGALTLGAVQEDADDGALASKPNGRRL